MKLISTSKKNNSRFGNRGRRHRSSRVRPQRCQSKRGRQGGRVYTKRNESRAFGPMSASLLKLPPPENANGHIEDDGMKSSASKNLKFYRRSFLMRLDPDSKSNFIGVDTLLDHQAINEAAMADTPQGALSTQKNESANSNLCTKTLRRIQVRAHSPRLES